VELQSSFHLCSQFNPNTGYTEYPFSPDRSKSFTAAVLRRHRPGILLHEQGIPRIIAGGMGQRAQQLFAQNDIQVVVGAPAESSGNLVKIWMDGTLTSGANACDH
jgi:predicted Fe-Mo cluster-binding NifX family protein